jgi:hypothetical protein
MNPHGFTLDRRLFAWRKHRTVSSGLQPKMEFQPIAILNAALRMWE